MEEQVWLRVLGPVQLRNAAGEWRSPPGQQLRLVLAFLALSAGHVIPAEDLVEVLWEERPPPSARASLQILVTRLRKQLAGVPGSLIERHGDGYQLHLGTDSSDVLAFRSLVGTARQDPDDRHATGVLGQALTLWRGPALADVPDTMRARSVRSGLAEEHMSAVQDRFGRMLAAGQDTEAAAEIPLMLARYPLAERLAGMLMTAWYRTGRQAEALQVFRDLRERLVRELGVEPGDELQRLHQRMLAGDLTLARRAMPPAQPVHASDLARPAGQRHQGTAVRPDRVTSFIPQQPGAGQAANGNGARQAGRLRTRALDAGPGHGLLSARSPAGTWRSAQASPGKPDKPDGSREDAADGRMAVVPRQVPAAPACFAGRQQELTTLTATLDPGAGSGPAIVAISGIPGVGKTALALHWAHQVQQRFPDGQLYVNLQGFAASRAPVTPADAIARLLEGAGIAASLVPADLESRAALCRSLLASRTMLIVLDNARDEAQVRPLLPGVASCPVLVTSRNELTGLIAAEGAHPLRLDVLSELEAEQLLAGRLGAARVAAEADAVADLTSLCARLPLALVIAAARAATRPVLPLALIADELRGIRRRLDSLDVGDEAINIKAVFSWSYRLLNEPAARMFRLLGAHPGPDISVKAAASLAGISVGSANAALGRLLAASIVYQEASGRFTMHDLLRAYASGVGDEARRPGELRRVLDYYLHTARAAVSLAYPATQQVKVAPAGDGTAPERFTSSAPARAWLRTEHHVLLAATAAAADGGFDVHAWQLAAVLREYLARRGDYADWAKSQRVAVAAARRLGDNAALALALRSLGVALVYVGSPQDARRQLMGAMTLYGKLGDSAGQASAHCGMAQLSESQGDHTGALYHAQHALRLYQAAGDVPGQASALNGVGWDYALLGDSQRALRYCAKALELYRDCGNRFGEALTLDSIGLCYQRAGRHGKAIASYLQALCAYADADDRYYRAHTLIRLGETHQASGNPAAARASWQQAVLILDDLRHHDAEAVRARLEGAQAAGA
ncbi:MAG TPA: BTAD domain-containing putative transcriptional regulator [Streptosporangiaceae bacterium]